MMTVNRRTTTVLAIIALILVLVFGITQWQRSVATQKLLADLPGNDYAKVMDAMTQLAERGHRVVPALLTHLQASEPEARWRAAVLLGEVGTQATWQPLMAALKDGTPEVRSAAAMALGKLGAKDATSELVARVADEKEDVGVRISAARAAGLLGDKSASQALQDVLRDRKVAFEALAGQAWAALKAAQDAVVAAQQVCLNEIQPPAQPLNEAPLTQEQIAKAKADKRIANEKAVVDAKKAVVAAQTKFDTANATFVAVGGKALGLPAKPAPAVAPAPAPKATPGAAPTPAPAPAPKPVVPAETPPLAADAKWELRAAAAAARGMIGDPEAVATMADSVNEKKEPNAEVRTATAYAMQDLARKVQTGAAAGGLVDALLLAQKDTIGDVRTATLLAMGFAAVPMAKQHAVEEALTKALQDDNFYWAREAARKTMKSMNMPVPEV